MTFGCTREIAEKDLFFPQLPFLSEWGDGVRSETVDVPDGSRLSVAMVGDSNNGVLFYFYGNGEQIDTSLVRMHWLNTVTGMQVICADYRGYGRSTGTPSLAALQSDAQLLLERFTSPESGPVLAYGRSIGTIPGISLAENGLVEGLILEAPFTTARDVTTAWSKQLPLPVRPFMTLVPDRVLAEQRQPIESMKDMSVSLLVIHGTIDEIIPFKLGRRMFDAAVSSDKAFCEVPGRGHNNLDITREPSKSAISAFIDGVREQTASVD